MSNNVQIDLQIEHIFRPGMYMKKMVLPAGHEALTHRHTFNHFSFLLKGRVIVTVDGKAITMDGPDCVLIRAGIEHHIEAITDSVWYCIHETDETDPDKIDHTLIEGI